MHNLDTKRFITALVFFLVGSMSSPAAGRWDSRLHTTQTRALIAWLDWDQMPKDMQQDEEAPWAICRELKTRREVPLLIAAYASSTNPAVRCYLASGVLGGIDDTRVERAFSKQASEQEDEENYYVLLYLAKRGSTNALAILNRHYFKYPVSSWQWSSAVELFGKAKYKPAITNLIESLDAASLNVSAAACWSLGQLFPGAPKKFKGPSEAKRYYANRIKGLPGSAVHPTGVSAFTSKTNLVSRETSPRR